MTKETLAARVFLITAVGFMPISFHQGVSNVRVLKRAVASVFVLLPLCREEGRT
jgi:hypothetical protein